MKNEKKRWICALSIVAIAVLAITIYPPVFYLNDDVTMRCILSGAYTGTPDGHAVYMLYPLTGVLAVLYRIVGFVPWMEVFFTVCIVSCMLLVMDQFDNPLLGGGFVVALYLPFCLYMHYTIVAAVVAATSVFFIAMGRKGVAPILLFVMAYMIRSQVGLLALPFWVGAVVWRMAIVPVKQWRGLLLAWGKYIGILLVSLFCCTLINQCFYSSPEWKTYKEYNESRTLLYDYTDFLGAEAYAVKYDTYGMSQEEYLILDSYNTMLDAKIDAAKMKEVAQLVSTGMKEKTTGIGWKDVGWQYYLYMRYNDVPYNLLWVGLYIVLFICFVVMKKWMPLLILGILGIGRSSIWMYLIWKGRFPERVSISLYIMELMLLLGMGLWLIQACKIRSKSIRWGFLVLCGLFILATGVYQWHSTIQRSSQQAHIQSEWTTLKWYCGEKEEHLYLVDVFSAVEYADFLFVEDASNIMLMGGWMSASPLANERFERVGYKDAAECLYYGKQVSLIVEKDSDITWLEEYLQNRFGECSLVEVAPINSREPKCFVEYQVVQNKE